jgi:uncharacterized membrane protein
VIQGLEGRKNHCVAYVVTKSTIIAVKTCVLENLEEMKTLKFKPRIWEWKRKYLPSFPNSNFLKNNLLRSEGIELRKNSKFWYQDCIFV